MGKRWSPLPIYAQVALGVLALLVVGSWVFRIPLSESLLHSRLSAMGIPAANVEITSLSPWRVDIRNLRLAGGARLDRGEAEIEWPVLFSPRLTKITLTGLELELGASSEGLNWRDLAPVLKGTAVNERDRGAESPARLPEIQIRDATAKVRTPDDTIVAELSAPTVSFVPIHDRVGDGVEGSTPVTVEVKADLILPDLRAHGWEVTNGALKVVGRIERRDGRLYYRSEGCDRVSLEALKKEHISVSGLLVACLKDGSQGPAVAIDHDGRISLDMLVEPERAQIDLDVATLPPIAVELGRGSLSLQFSQGSEGPLVGSIALRDLDLSLPVAGLSLDGVEVSAMTGTEAAPQIWSFALGAQALHHRTAFPALLPLTIEGKGKWAPEALTVDTAFRQSIPGLNGTFHLHRDNETGEGTVEFDLSPLEFRESALDVSDVSPFIGQYVTRLTGEVQASGKILFNDAWATPVQIAGTGNNLVMEMKPSSSAQEALAVDFGRSRFSISLPPLSPERGWATLDVAGGGLRLGDADHNDLTGTINFLSLWPLTCPRGSEPGTTTMSSEDGIAATIFTCFYDALAVAAEPN